MSSIYKILTFLNLLDRDQNLSITNVAVIVMVAKLAFLPSFTLTEVSAFVIAMLNYGHKRYESCKHKKVEESQSSNFVEKLEEIESKVSAMALKVGLKR